MNTNADIIFLGHAEEEVVRRHRREKVKRLRRKVQAYVNLSNRFEHLLGEAHQELAALRVEARNLRRETTRLNRETIARNVDQQELVSLRENVGTLNTEIARLNREANERSTCSVCLDVLEHAKDVQGLTAFNCGHVTCTDCSNRLRDCPQCRTRIRERTQLYLN